MRESNEIFDRGMRAAVLISGALAAFAAGVGFDKFVLNNKEGVVAAGTVECASGRDVEGVWIETRDGAGWAFPSSNPHQKNISSFKRPLPHPEIYGVHVGCGGSPDNWASTNYSNSVSTGEFSDFICYDTPAASTARHRLGKCAVIHS
jgi:hypothetical protein